MIISELQQAIDRQRPGWSLEQPFYISPEIYEFERRGWLADQWYILGHGSEIAQPGSYVVRELLGESLIIVRDKGGAVRGFHNVCRHRGSRICDRDGTGASFTCPYHGWTYRLDGSLRSAPAMSRDIDLSKLSLHPAPVREIGGLIFASLHADAKNLDSIREGLDPLFIYQGLPQARIAVRRSYPTAGNWKLLLENFEECYHCLPAHPEYCGVMQNIINVSARDPSPQDLATWKETVARWYREEANAESPIKDAARDYADGRGPEFRVRRQPIGPGRKTPSADGRPVAPLMGKVPRFDGGVTACTMRPFVRFHLLNDHAVIFQFLPIGPELTDVVVTWLVDGSAKESEVDIERLVWLWEVTTLQDKILIERNVAGIHSSAYQPGPYSTLEDWSARFVNNYLKGIHAYCKES